MNPFRALIVEDDRSWRQILSEILSDFGLMVDVAENAEDAFALLKSQTHRLAVVDLSLSPNDHNNYDGLRVLDAVRKLDPNCQTILLTGFATVELAVTALTDYGAFTFLRKESFHRTQFRDIINRILATAPPQLVASTISPLKTPKALHPKPSAGKVLIVEDDAGWRNILEELLGDLGYQTRACASFGDAIGHLRREKFALAVVDLSLRGTYAVGDETPQDLDGYQLLSSVYTDGIPIIVVSGVADPVEIQKIYTEYSISAYIEKQTFDRAVFRRAVEETRSASPIFNKLSALTDRERETLDLLAQGYTNKEIAERLIITTNTVKRHLKAIYAKLGVHTRSAATAQATGGHSA